MTSTDPILSSLASIGLILATMALFALVETAAPLRPRTPWSRAHVGPNLALTFLTFATNIAFSVGIVGVLVWLETHALGVMRLVALPSLLATALTVLALDLSFYVAHTAMHRTPVFWRFHRVHHSDPTVDVTTTIRQHPGESLIRYGFMSGAAVVLGASPGAFALYRVWAALQGLLEHANVRLPSRLDRALALIVTTPNMHKVHHSRAAAETNTNYGNIFSLFDRLCGTFTPSARGPQVVCGLDGLDDPATQTTSGLLALPFRDTASARSTTSASVA